MSMYVLSDAVRLATSSTRTAFSLASLSILSALALSSAAKRASLFVSRAISDGESEVGLVGSVCRVRSASARTAAVLLCPRSYKTVRTARK